MSAAHFVCRSDFGSLPAKHEAVHVLLRSRYSESASYRRIEAARIIGKCNKIEERLIKGELNLTNLLIIKPLLNDKNTDEILDKAKNLSKFECEKLVASLIIKEKMRDCIRKQTEINNTTKLTETSIVSKSVNIAINSNDFINDGLINAATNNESITINANTTDVQNNISENKNKEPSFITTLQSSKEINITGSNTDSCNEINFKSNYDKVKPVGRDQIRISFSADDSFIELLEKAKTLLSHKYPHASLNDVFFEALNYYVKKHDKVKLLDKSKCKTIKDYKKDNAQQEDVAAMIKDTSKCLTKEDKEDLKQENTAIIIKDENNNNVNCNRSHLHIEEVLAQVKSNSNNHENKNVINNKSSRYISAELKRFVWQRDGNKCTYASKDGKLCGSAFQLEIDHIIPVAFGGKTEADNLRLTCRAHNQWLATKCGFGKKYSQIVEQTNFL